MLKLHAKAIEVLVTWHALQPLDEGVPCGREVADVAGQFEQPGGGLDDQGRLQFEIVEGSDYEVPCDMVMTAVGQQALSEELDKLGMMERGCVITSDANMGTSDPKVFSAGDSAFGGSTIVMAMHHGQRAAYYVKAFLEGHEDPMPYRQPYRTRRVPLAQDLEWEKLPVQEAEFHGLGEKPIEFPEIEDTYGDEAARKEAARCYRCDAETGTADYAVRHREDIFAMARTNPLDEKAHATMLARRLTPRTNPFPEDRLATLDDLTFLPANLTRLVIDPYREACRIDTRLGAGRLTMGGPFLATGFDDVPEQVRCAVGWHWAEG